MPNEYAVHLRRYLSSAHPRRELPVWEIFFRILHLYSTQLPSGRSDVSLKVAGVSFDSLCQSDRHLYQLNKAEIIASQRYYCTNSGRTTKPGEC